MENITGESLHRLFTYAPETGVFLRRVSTGNNAPAGGAAGTVTVKGYLVINVQGKQRMASRLAWCYMTGTWPARNVIFVDGDKTNCAWENLRLAGDEAAVTQERLREVFDYDPAVGHLVYRRNRGGLRLKGDIAGFICRRDNRHGGGYRLVGFNGREYGAHRLIWVWWYGREAEGHIDHANMERDDNRIANLRECTRAQNMMNLRKPPNNTSGVKGVGWSSAAKKWRAYIGKEHIGLFPTIEEATQARQQAAEARYGAFARHA